MEETIESLAFPTYSAYKDSGIEWLGEIPGNWKIKRIKHLFREINERSMDGEEELLSVSQFTGVTKKSDKTADGDLISNAATLEGYKKVFKGDLVSNIMLAWNGSLAFSDFDGITSPAYSVYRVKSMDYNRYFHYLFRTELYKSEFKKKSSGVIESRLRLYTDNFFRIEAILPPLPEQKVIADFLDKKTAMIDKAIQIKEKQIALLQERRQILIQQAVTKGLDPNVKLKDSSVDWIGMIPEHWEVKKLKYLVEILKRIIGYEGPDVLSITQKGIKIKDIESGEGQLAQNYSNYQIIKKGEFAMNHMDLLTGYVDISSFDGVISPDYRVFDVSCNEIFEKYLLLVFQLGYKNKIFYRYGQGVSQLGRWRFPAENFRNFLIPIPPFEEQERIVEHLEKFTKKSFEAISYKEQEIQRLKEYKSTLINSAVTGKIKVVGV